jgi:hypothetical protein
MSVSISGNVGAGGVGVSVSGIIPVVMPPFPAVLPFPGVPPLAVGFGASIGLPGGNIAGGFSAGPGGVSGGLSGSLGPVSGGLNFGPGGVSGGAAIGIPGIGGGSVSIGPEGITGNFGVGIGGLSVNLSGSMTGGVSPFGLSMISSLPPLLTADQPGSLFQGPRWGIFDKNGQPVGAWDSVVKVAYRHEMRIADFPIEGGAFASYNKVQVPFDIRISFAIGSGAGGTNRRTKLLSDLEQAVQSLDFYTVATPEATYPQANLTHLEYARETQRGVNLLVIDVFVQEVRPAAGAAFTNADAGNVNPKEPTAKGAANNGQSQPQVVAPGTLTGAEQPTPGGAVEPMPTLGTGSDAPSPANITDTGISRFYPNAPTESAPLVPGTSVVPVAPPGGDLGQFTTPDPTAVY